MHSTLDRALVSTQRCLNVAGVHCSSARGARALEAQHAPGPAYDGLVGGQRPDGRAFVVAPGLPRLEVHLALADAPGRRVVRVVVDHRLGVAGAREAAHVGARGDELVAVEVVLVPRLLRADAEPLPRVGVDVAVVVVVVAAEVVLHAVAAVDEEVVVRAVVGGAVVVVDVLLVTISTRARARVRVRAGVGVRARFRATVRVGVRARARARFRARAGGWARVRVRVRAGARLRAVVVDEEVVVYLAPLHLHRGRAGAHRRQEGLPVPRVEGPVVAALAAGREDEIVRDLVAPAEAVVGIDPGAGPVEVDVDGVSNIVTFLYVDDSEDAIETKVSLEGVTEDLCSFYGDIDGYQKLYSIAHEFSRIAEKMRSTAGRIEDSADAVDDLFNIPNE